MTFLRIKNQLRSIRDRYRNWQIARYLSRRIAENRPNSQHDFDFTVFKTSVTDFLRSMQIDVGEPLYRYSNSCRHPTLYASAYACMTLSLLDEMRNFSDDEKKRWVDYFDSFQDESSGLFHDPVVAGDFFLDTDWWGARHLALHMISAYTGLGARPRHPFRFLAKYYDTDVIDSWLDEIDWNGPDLGGGDEDNKIMNIGGLLQYQRDTWGDAEAGHAVEYLKTCLLSKVNQETGMWGVFNPTDRYRRSRMVQFSYHLFPIFFYDGYLKFDGPAIVDTVLKTQNRFGGFGVKFNSSACEDIDSLDILMRLHDANLCSLATQSDIRAAVKLGLDWVIENQVDDGGFVFRLNEPFSYGHQQTSSLGNQGAMLPTWFRTLSICYITRFLDMKNDFVVSRCPGYEF